VTYFSSDLGGETVRLFVEFGEKDVQVTAGEGPFERLGRLLVARLEIHQLVLELGEGREVVAGKQFTLDDGEVDFDLVEPTGVNRRMDQDDVGPLGVARMTCRYVDVYLRDRSTNSARSFLVSLMI
jgi:hypothetical protein